MGYAAEKEKVEKKVKRTWRIFFFIVAGIALALLVFSCFYPMESWKYYFSKPEIAKRQAGELRIHFLDVGQGDATIVELPDGKIMLVDGGNGSDDTKKTVMRYLNALKIDVIDYLVVTHADEDHCGSLDEVLALKEVRKAFVPVGSATKDGEYGEFFAKLLEEDCEWEFSSRGIDLSVFGETGYTLKFLYPYTVDVEQEIEMETNDSSCVIWLDYQGASALFTGDAPFATEEKLMRDFQLGLTFLGVPLTDTEILKVSHHGSRYATSLKFLEFLGVETAVISCGKNNAYKHPSDEVLRNLASCGASVYRTDESGSVVLTISKSGEYTASALANKGS